MIYTDGVVLVYLLQMNTNFHHSICAIIMAAGIGFAAEPSDYMPLIVPEGAQKVEIPKISIPLAHKAKLGLLLYEKLVGDKSFSVITPDQAKELAGDGYKTVKGLQPILVKWSFLEPVNQKGIDVVTAFEPTVHSKDGVLYVFSTGMDIGEVAKVVEGVMIVQVEKEPKSVIGKISKTGW